MTCLQYRALWLMALSPLACTVPELRIEEHVSERPDASAADGIGRDAGVVRPLDAGTPVQTGEPNAGAEAPSAGDAAASGPTNDAGSTGGAEAGSGAAGQASAGSGGMTDSGAAGTGGATEPMQPARACLLWTSVNVRNGPPSGAIEAGFETVAGVTARQYICRIRPAGSIYAIPGKYVERVGCYVAHRPKEQVTTVAVQDGLIDVLVPKPGCTFSWRAASPSELPEGAVDLGDPAEGRHYACRGDYMTIGSTGVQVGTILPSTDDPPVNQCWFESFSSAIQPKDPTQFEVLVLDPP